jgi:hypothetical protein
MHQIAGGTPQLDPVLPVSRDLKKAQCGGAIFAFPLMPAISSGAGAEISPITLIDWLTGSTRPPRRVTRAA